MNEILQAAKDVLDTFVVNAQGTPVWAIAVVGALAASFGRRIIVGLVRALLR